MRTKTRTTIDIKPGMVIRSPHALPGTPYHPFREVAAVTPGPWPNTRYITFTDGPGDWYHANTEWAVARGKTIRSAAKGRAAQQAAPAPTFAQAVAAYSYAMLGRRVALA